jgi:hypothetical protein
MPTYKTKKGDNIKTIKPISRVGQKLLGMKNVRKTTKKNIGGFLETFSPAYSIAKGKGPIGEMVRGGKGMGILGMMANQADKRSRPIDGIASKGKTKGRMI